MHAGGANTVLRNNRKLLKKRSSRFKSKRTVMGLKDEDVIRKDEQNRRLTTMSASEIRKIGRKLRRRRRIETVFLLLIILAALIFVFSSFKFAVKVPKTVMLQTELQILSVDKPKTPADEYMDFGVYFYREGQFKRAETMFIKALQLQPDHCHAIDWLNNTRPLLKSNKDPKPRTSGNKNTTYHVYSME